MKERLALEGDEWINNRRGELLTSIMMKRAYVIGFYGTVNAVVGVDSTTSRNVRHVHPDY